MRKDILDIIQSLIDKIGEDIEVIIVDNESNDNSLRVVKTFDFLNVKEYTISKNDYTGEHLNIGIMESNNPYTLILSHCEIKSFDVKSVTQKLDGDVVDFGENNYQFGMERRYQEDICGLISRIVHN